VRHWRTLIEKDFLGAWDLRDPKTEKPRDFTLKIATVQAEALWTRGAKNARGKCVIRFHGAKKAFVVNTTNCETIAGMYGDDVDQWVGKLITLYPSTTTMPDKKTKQRVKVPCVRVRPQKPAEKAPAEELPDHTVDEAQRAEQDAAFGRDEPAADWDASAEKAP